MVTLTWRGKAATKTGKAGFTAEAQSTQRFFYYQLSLCVLSASVVRIRKFAQATQTFPIAMQ